MSLTSSLLQAIVRADGDALVIDVGQTPYVVTEGGPVELPLGTMTSEAIRPLVAALLTDDARRRLDHSSAVHCELPPIPELPDERFSVSAVRMGDEIWMEILRNRRLAVEREPLPEKPQVDSFIDDDLEWIRGLPDSLAAPRARVSRLDAEGASDLGVPAWNELVAPPVRSREPAGVPPPAPPSVPPPAPKRLGVAALPPPSTLDRLLRIAAEHGASVLYVISDARPAIRVEGEVLPLSDEPALGSSEVDALLAAALTRGAPGSVQSGDRAEWVLDVPGVGRVRCQSLRDLRGASGVFRITIKPPVSVEQLGLSPQIQALALEPEGLVLIVGSRLSGKSTLMSALVDLINRTHHTHVITLEHHVHVVHDPRGSTVSQREIRGDAGELLAAVRAALDDDPDVLVIEDLRSDEVARLALHAAESRLVIAGLSAHTAADSVDVLLNKHPAADRPRAAEALAAHLVGIVALVPLRKVRGGRVVAREVLLNTPAVAKLIEEGRTSELPRAIEKGRALGMVSLNDTLTALVSSGDVGVLEAFRRAGDQRGLLTRLQALGIDTSGLGPS